MPQNQLTGPPHTDLVIQVHDLIYQGDAAFIVTVKTADLDAPLSTVSVQRYAGLGVDCLESAIGAVVRSWLYQGTRDVKRTADAQGRAARRHAEDHEASRPV
jgi:hypothetical protein